MLKYPVYIPSKGRAGLATTPNLLGGLQPILAVEAPEADAYKGAFPHADILALDPVRDRGVQRARQACLEHARRLGVKAHWQLDDDLTRFCRVENRRARDCFAVDALAYGEGIMDAYARVGMVGYNTREYAWGARKAWDWNRFGARCVLINTTTGIDYDPGLFLAEDLVFWLAHVEAFWRTVKVNAYGITTQAVSGELEGGCSDVYSTENANRCGKAAAARMSRFLEFLPLKPGQVIGWSRIRYDAIDAHLAKFGQKEE